MSSAVRRMVAVGVGEYCVQGRRRRCWLSGSAH